MSFIVISYIVQQGLARWSYIVAQGLKKFTLEKAHVNTLKLVSKPSPASNSRIDIPFSYRSSHPSENNDPHSGCGCWIEFDQSVHSHSIDSRTNWFRPFSIRWAVHTIESAVSHEWKPSNSVTLHYRTVTKRCLWLAGTHVPCTQYERRLPSNGWRLT